MGKLQSSFVIMLRCQPTLTANFSACISGNYGNTTGASSGTGTAYLSGTPEFTPDF